MGCAVGCCLIVLFILSALNVWLILGTMHPILFYHFLKVYSYSWAATLITPGQLGDVSLILFLKKHGISFHHTGVTYMIDKVITILVFLAVGWYGTNLLIPDLKGILSFLLASGFLLTVLLVILFKYLPTQTQLAKHLRHQLYVVLSDLKIFRAKWYILVINIVITIVKWLTLSLCYFTAFFAFNVYAKWPEIAVIPIMSTLIGYIPISIGGIGTVELTATYLFSKVGIEQSVVLSAYLLLRSLQFVFASCAVVSLGRTNQKTRKM
jgi:uncharacterized membrane protein YbhN (UPF0104 family)